MPLPGKAEPPPRESDHRSATEDRRFESAKNRQRGCRIPASGVRRDPSRPRTPDRPLRARPDFARTPHRKPPRRPASKARLMRPFRTITTASGLTSTTAPSKRHGALALGHSRRPDGSSRHRSAHQVPVSTPVRVAVLLRKDRQRTTSPGIIHRPAVRIRGQRDVIRILISTLDLECTHTRRQMSAVCRSV